MPAKQQLKLNKQAHDVPAVDFGIVKGVMCGKCEHIYVYPCHGKSRDCENRKYVDGEIKVPVKKKVVRERLKLKKRTR